MIAASHSRPLETAIARWTRLPARRALTVPAWDTRHPNSTPLVVHATAKVARLPASTSTSSDAATPTNSAPNRLSRCWPRRLVEL